MLHDRDYMRSLDPNSRRSWTVTLIVVLVAFYVLQLCFRYNSTFLLNDWFALSLDGIKHGRVWQLLTFQFLHSVPLPWHILFNCVGLYFLGRSVEETLGSKKFLMLYFTSGVLGGVLQLLVTAVLPNHPDGPVVGASAGIMGLLAAYSTMFPLREITTFVMFFPITLRMQYLFWIVFAFSLFGTIAPYDNVANAAHLGGLLTGVGFIRLWMSPSRTRAEWNPLRRKMRRERMVKAATAMPARSRRASASEETEDLPSEEFISKEVDPILDKISAHGIQSLTERERKILQVARSKMAKR